MLCEDNIFFFRVFWSLLCRRSTYRYYYSWVPGMEDWICPLSIKYTPKRGHASQVSVTTRDGTLVSITVTITVTLNGVLASAYWLHYQKTHQCSRRSAPRTLLMWGLKLATLADGRFDVNYCTFFFSPETFYSPILWLQFSVITSRQVMITCSRNL